MHKHDIRNLQENAERYLYDLLIKGDPSKYDYQKLDSLLDLLLVYNPDFCSPDDTVKYTDQSYKQTQKITLFPRKNNRKIVAVVSVAAAACLLSIMISALGHSVTADPDTGFFHWIEKDTDGITMITDPSESSSHITGTVEVTEIENILDLFNPSCITDNLTLLTVEYSFAEGEEYTRKHYGDNGGRYVEIGIDSKDITEEYIYCYHQTLKNATVKIFFHSALQEYLFVLQPDDISFYVKGNIDIKKISAVMEEYVQFILDEEILQ